MTITGRDGVDLHTVWGQRPYAYLGITVPGFPNFFMTYGPGTHLAHGGSLILNSELQMHYIDQCLAHLVNVGARTLEPLPEPTHTWHQRYLHAIRQTVWAHPSIKHSYFKNAAGEIYTVSPWRLSEYRSAIDEPVWSDFKIQEA